MLCGCIYFFNLLKTSTVIKGTVREVESSHLAQKLHFFQWSFSVTTQTTSRFAENIYLTEKYTKIDSLFSPDLAIFSYRRAWVCHIKIMNTFFQDTYLGFSQSTVTICLSDIVHWQWTLPSWLTGVSLTLVQVKCSNPMEPIEGGIREPGNQARQGKPRYFSYTCTCHEIENYRRDLRTRKSSKKWYIIFM